jgi:predicted nucleic acid-binding OB-fold protein
MIKKRTHLLLESDQHQALAQIARREGKSLSEVAREIVQEGIKQRQHAFAQEINRQLHALERARKVREKILEERDGILLDLNISNLIQEGRGERDDQTLRRGD